MLPVGFIFLSTFSFVRCRKYDIPSIDFYQIAPTIFSKDQDPSRTIIDASLIDDLIEWDKYEIEFTPSLRSTSALKEKGLEIEYTGFKYICEMPQQEISDNLSKRQESFNAEIKKWTTAVRPLSKKVLTYVNIVLVDHF
jgi:hypothetical protein